jgi:arylsulfatase A-like enzyme
MPNLAKLAATGTQYANAWVGQLPSLTETSHATIGTGVLPSRHLILGDTWRVPGTNQMAPNLLNSQLTRTGFIGHTIQHEGVPTLAAAIRGQYPGSTVATVSGHKVYAADAMGAGAADWVAFGATNKGGHFVPLAIPGHTPALGILGSPQLLLPSYPRTPGVEDGWTTTLAEKLLFKYHPRLLMVNLPEVDTVGHAVGTNATVMQPLISDVDKQIGRLVAAYSRAGMLSQTEIVVTSDHGMVPAVHTLGSTTIDAVIKGAGGQPLYEGHGDFRTIWLKNLDAVPRVAAALARARLPDVLAVYAKNIKGQYVLASSPSLLADPGVQGAYADLLSSFDCAESPDIVVMYDENTMTLTPTLIKINRKGDHGGATWGAQHIPLVLWGPGVRSGYTSTYGARLVDIAPTVETLMGVQPQHQDGVPLADAMTAPPAWATSAQRQIATRMSNDVHALAHEAALRPNAR